MLRAMTTQAGQAKGAFEVKLSPQPDEGIGRLLIDKRFSGDLDATSRGQMLAHRTTTEGSAGYVAMEIVTGTLAGRSGTFVLQHSGTMNRGVAQLTLTVVPDSGVGDFVGLTGSMVIIIEGSKHSYVFDYALA